MSKIININKNKADELKSKIQGRGPDAKPELAETQDNLILTSAIRDFHKSKGNKQVIKLEIGGHSRQSSIGNYHSNHGSIAVDDGRRMTQMDTILSPKQADSQINMLENAQGVHLTQTSILRRSIEDERKELDDIEELK